MGGAQIEAPPSRGYIYCYFIHSKNKIVGLTMMFVMWGSLCQRLAFIHHKHLLSCQNCIREGNVYLSFRLPPYMTIVVNDPGRRKGFSQSVVSVADLENFEGGAEHLLAACGRWSLIVIGDNSGSRSRSVVIHVVS